LIAFFVQLSQPFLPLQYLAMGKVARRSKKRKEASFFNSVKSLNANLGVENIKPARNRQEHQATGSLV